MSKSLYSLMLSDEVVAEIDMLAMKNGLTRSGMVNAVLAEYASMLTPEKRIAQLCSILLDRFGASRSLVPVSAAGRSSVCAKSALEYKYRPTIRYELQLFRESYDGFGELNVIFRTTAAGLLELLDMFFREFILIEKELYPGKSIAYELGDGKFSRSINIDTKNGNAEDGEIGVAISEYVEELDRMLKMYVSGQLTTDYVKNYQKRMSEKNITI